MFPLSGCYESKESQSEFDVSSEDESNEEPGWQDQGFEYDMMDGMDSPDEREEFSDIVDGEEQDDDSGGDWCYPTSGCLDGCCSECENGGGLEFGGCWSNCDEYPETDCRVICPPYTCEHAWFLWPGCTFTRDGFCMTYGFNSFWYEGRLTARLVGEYPDPDCPDENPCCQVRFYEIGFNTTVCTPLDFIPLDMSLLPHLGWGCAGSNCGYECMPSEGTVVRVHVTWFPDHIDLPEKLIVEEVCQVL